MAERKIFDPVHAPEEAAQEVLLELCQAGTFGFDNGGKAATEDEGARVADAAIAFHRKLTEYYKGLKSGR